jgi:hypothetical protein
MFGLTALELARIQFGFTISAHSIFPATTNLFAGQAIRRGHLDQGLDAALAGHRGEANT